MGSDVESDAKDTLKLTARGRTRSATAHTQTDKPRHRSRDETKKEIQADEDEATLRELLIRYLPCCVLTLIDSLQQRFLFVLFMFYV